MRMLVISVLLISLTACGQAEHEIANHEARDYERTYESNQFTVEDEPFSGIVFAAYDNGQRAFEIELKDGFLHGFLRRWTENGQKTQETEAYIESAKDGRIVKHRKWTRDGTLIQLRDFNDEGEWVLAKQWRKDGSLEVVKKQDDQGHPLLDEFWCETDQKKEQRGYEDGLLIEGQHWSCETGEQISHLRFKPRERDRQLFTSPTDPDNLLSRGHAHGVQKFWYPDGTLERKVHFENGKKSGTEETYYEDGQPKLKASWDAITQKDRYFVQQVNIGEYREWYSDGDPKVIGEFTDSGNKTGLWREWHSDGNVSVRDYDRDAYIDTQYLEPFGEALAEGPADTAMYYINRDLVRVDAKLPTESNARNLSTRRADRWPKAHWTYPIIIARRDLITPLIEAGADIEAKDSEGRTRLLLCAQLLLKGHCTREGLQIVLDAGGDTKTTDSSGKTVLHKLILARAGYRSRESEQAKALKTLIEAGAPVNAQDNQGRTALMLALAERRADLANAILDANPDLNLENDHGQKAIHYVFLTEHDEYSYRDNKFTRNLLKRLVDAGADIDAPMVFNENPVTLHDIAVQHGSIDLAQYMEALGAGDDSAG